jgi:steroid 5-alpha reductase family enzyme
MLSLTNDVVVFGTQLMKPWQILGLTILASIALFSLLWAIHVKKVDASIVDLFWPGSFVLTFAVCVAMTGRISAAGVIVGLFLGIWAFRLTIHMVSRHRFLGAEDGRYRSMRASAGENFWRTSFFTVFLLQSMLQLLIVTPLILTALYQDVALNAAVMVCGGIIALAGLIIESLADWQLARFIRIPDNRGRLMTGGLYALSRHPNYFGEILFWWGIGIIAYDATDLTYVFAGPALLTFLLLRVSGVALLNQRHAATKPGYAEWAARTPALIPWPRRRAEGRDSSAPRQAAHNRRKRPRT